jgi:hypothetical protein
MTADIRVLEELPQQETKCFFSHFFHIGVWIFCKFFSMGSNEVQASLDNMFFMQILA